MERIAITLLVATLIALLAHTLVPTIANLATIANVLGQ
jgi:hypothetical protein